MDCGQCGQSLTVVSDWVTLCRILVRYAQWGMGMDGLMGAAHQAAAYLGVPGEAEAVLPVLHARLSMVASTPKRCSTNSTLGSMHTCNCVTNATGSATNAITRSAG